MDQTAAAGSGASGEPKIENASSSFSILTQPPAGSVANNADGTFSFNPGPDFRDLAAGESKTVSFTFLLARSEVVSATVTVTGTSDGPIATDVQYNSLGAADPAQIAEAPDVAVPAQPASGSQSPEANQEANQAPFGDVADTPESEVAPEPFFGAAPILESEPVQEHVFDDAPAQAPEAAPEVAAVQEAAGQESTFDAAPAQDLEELEFSEPAAASTSTQAEPAGSVPSAADAWDHSAESGGSAASEISDQASPWDEVSPTVEAVQWSDAADSETTPAMSEAVDSPDQVDAWAAWGGLEPEVTETEVVDAGAAIAGDEPVQDQGFAAPAEPAAGGFAAPAAFEPVQIESQNEANFGAAASGQSATQTEVELGVAADTALGFEDDPWGGHTASDDDPWGAHTTPDPAAGLPADSEVTSEEVVAPVESAPVELAPIESAPVEPGPVEDLAPVADLASVDTGVADGCIISQPAAGRAIDNGDGTFDFDPGEEFNDLQSGETQEVTFSVRLPTGEDYQATVTVAGDPAGPYAKDVTFDRLPLGGQAEPQPVDAAQDDAASAAAADFAAFGSGSGFGSSFEADAPAPGQGADLAAPTNEPEAAVAPAGDEPAASSGEPESGPSASDWPVVDSPAFSDIEDSALALEESEDPGVEAPASEAPALEMPAAETSPASESNGSFMTGFGGSEWPETSEAPDGESPASEPPVSEITVSEPESGGLGEGTPSVEAPSVEAPSVEAPSVEAPVPQEPIAADDFSSGFALESDPAPAARPAETGFEVQAPEGEGTAFAPLEDSGPATEEPASPMLPESSPAVDTPLEAGSIWPPVDDKPSEPQAEGRPDTLQLSGVTAGPGAGGWDIRLTSGEILEQNPGCVILSQGAAGTLQLDDSTVRISFNGIERIVW